MTLPRLWISTPRPNHLVNALAATVALRGRFSGCCFIYEHSSWWDNAKWEEYAPAFEEIVVLDRVTTCRGLRDLPRLSRALRLRQQQLLKMRVGPRDVFLCVSSVTGVSNAIASAFPHHVKIFCASRKAYEDASRPVSFLRYRFTTSSALEYIYLYPKLGLLRTLHLKPWLPKGGDGARLERPQQAIEAIYQAIILWSNEGAAATPPALADEGKGAPVLLSPYANLQDFASELAVSQGSKTACDHRQAVVFFGTPFLLVRNLSPDRYTAVLDRCLEYLRRFYGAACRLIYRPHPAETCEQESLNLTGFEVEDDLGVAELYFLKNFMEIRAVYSVSSTVSRVAYNYGLNAYALWPCFPFNEQAREYFRTLMDVVPPGFEVHCLESPPVAYNAATIDNPPERFGDILKIALDHAVD